MTIPLFHSPKGHPSAPRPVETEPEVQTVAQGVARETLKTHAALFDRMGQAMGLDLQEEAISGHLQFDEIADAVLRCTRCACPKTCSRFMDRLTTEITQTPDYCRNADLLAYLKEEQEEG